VEQQGSEGNLPTAVLPRSPRLTRMYFPGPSSIPAKLDRISSPRLWQLSSYSSAPPHAALLQLVIVVKPGVTILSIATPPESRNPRPCRKRHHSKVVGNAHEVSQIVSQWQQSILFAQRLPKDTSAMSLTDKIVNDAATTQAVPADHSSIGEGKVIA